MPLSEEEGQLTYDVMQRCNYKAEQLRKSFAEEPQLMTELAFMAYTLLAHTVHMSAHFKAGLQMEENDLIAAIECQAYLYEALQKMYPELECEGKTIDPQERI